MVEKVSAVVAPFPASCTGNRRQKNERAKADRLRRNSPERPKFRTNSLLPRERMMMALIGLEVKGAVKLPCNGRRVHLTRLRKPLQKGPSATIQPCSSPDFIKCS